MHNIYQQNFKFKKRHKQEAHELKEKELKYNLHLSGFHEKPNRNLVKMINRSWKYNSSIIQSGDGSTEEESRWNEYGIGKHNYQVENSRENLTISLKIRK